jgi:uncharacterized DUF497 family protein
MERLPANFDWDDGNREKCQQHGLSIVEIEYVLRHGETFIVPDLKNFEDEPRFIAVGRSSSGRYAFVVFHASTEKRSNGLAANQRTVHAQEGDRTI